MSKNIDIFLKRKLVEKGLLPADGGVVYSTGRKQKEVNPGSALLMWNARIRGYNGGFNGSGPEGIFRARKLAMDDVIKSNDGIAGFDSIFLYFKERLPHLFSCNQECRKPCRALIVNILRKLSASSFSFPIRRVFDLPQYKTAIVHQERGTTAKIEVRRIYCAFHRDRVKDIFILESKVPICSGCRTRLFNAYQKRIILIGASEEEIKSWLEAQAIGEED